MQTAITQSETTLAGTWWLSCRKFTVKIRTDRLGTITDAAPIVSRFRGQPLRNLRRWAMQFGGFQLAFLG